ncbi:PEP-CTERM sorting domain-containing protein [Desulfonema ishimotonii]|uniref:PEP-CTERM sorting domain-containing protein n=1 Tax=Desulfonema ishimotonii TaxID=45657 RepID=UPI00140A915A|nr:PEP-CTERM sorting domain-containing protein [Desulfonema ishimotonii]
MESFENFAPASAGLTIDFGEAGMATLTGGYVSGSWDAGAIASGRFSTTPSGDQFLEVQTSPDPEGGTGTFSLEFETEQSAFGFFGTDFEGSQTDLIFETVIGETFTLNIPFSNPSPTGSALFWGFIDTERQFTKVTFNGVNLFRDWFGFDDFTIGTEDQVVSPVPEPATMALLGIGLIGLAAVRRKRTSRL